MKTTYVLWGLALLLVAALAGNGFLYQERTNLEVVLDITKQREQQTKATLASTTLALENLGEAYIDLKDDYDDLKDDYDDYVDEYGDAIETAKKLAKLATIDEEVLKKYSKANFLNENYSPKRLREIDSRYILAGRQTQFFVDQALPFLEEMLEEAEDDGIDLKIVSAYRSFDLQSELKGQYTLTYGSGANTFSADQGFSEHQLGTTVDFSDTATNGLYTSFEKTRAFRWLQENAYKYGFVLSYPKGNTFYIYEPWHWRFVGEDLARDLKRANANFYDWEQRRIDEYLLEVFD